VGHGALRSEAPLKAYSITTILLQPCMRIKKAIGEHASKRFEVID
jgi:hypothetical protein